jgi:Protein of unknown function (DUF3011)
MCSRLWKFLSLLVPVVLVLAGARSYAETFNCSSNGEYQECQIPGHGNRNDLRLVRQLSRRPCEEGRTWGRHGNRVWVDDGCRADFAIGRGDYDDRARNDGDAYNDHDHDRDHDRDHWGRPDWDRQPAYYAGDFRGGHSYCSSRPGSEVVYCQSGGAFKYANPLRVSDACVQNRTWGISQYGLWVANGCSGEWEIKREGGDQRAGNFDSGDHQSGPGWDRQPAYYAGNFRDGHSHCSAAPGPSRTYCQSGGAFRYANPLQVNAACIQNRTWGVSQYGLWVTNGCAGEWEIKR